MTEGILHHNHGELALPFRKAAEELAPSLVLEFTARGEGLRSFRRLQSRLLELQEGKSSTVLLGSGIRDWAIADLRAPRNTLVDVDEAINSLQVLCRSLRPFSKNLVLIIPKAPSSGAHVRGEATESKQVDIFISALEECSQTHDNLFLALYESNGKGECTLELPDHGTKSVYATGSKKGRLEMARALLAFSVSLRDSSPRTRASTSPKTALSGRGPVPLPFFQVGDPRNLELGGREEVLAVENAGVDEGQEEFGKTQHAIGGRTLFERRLQLLILDTLKAASVESRPRVMIIGDSIRMRIGNGSGYGLHAYRQLMSEVNILHIPHNTGNSRVGVRYMREWLKLSPDLVHLNFGLHDCSFSPKTGRPSGTSNKPEIYAANLREIIGQIREYSSAKIVWATSTPVNEEAHRTVPGKETLRSVTRRNKDINHYNKVSLSVMEEFGVAVTDLHRHVVEAGVDDCLLPDGVHLNHRGGKLLGTRVGESIMANLRG